MKSEAYDGCTLRTLMATTDGAHLHCCRTTEEFATSHTPGAINIPVAPAGPQGAPCLSPWYSGLCGRGRSVGVLSAGFVAHLRLPSLRASGGYDATIPVLTAAIAAFVLPAHCDRLQCGVRYAAGA